MEEVEEIQHKANLRIQNTEKKYEKKVALLEQKLELVNIMLHEARERELRSKKSYQTLMMTLNDLESHSKNNTMIKIEKEIQLLRQEKNDDAQNYRTRCDELFTMLESSIKKDTEFYSSKKNSLMNELIKEEDAKPSSNAPNPEDEKMDQKILTSVNNENMRLRREIKEIEIRNKELFKTISDLERQLKTEQNLYANNLEKLRLISENGVDPTLILRLKNENAILKAKNVDQNQIFSQVISDIRNVLESGSADILQVKADISKLVLNGQNTLSIFSTSVAQFQGNKEKNAQMVRTQIDQIMSTSGLAISAEVEIQPQLLGEVYSYQPNYEDLFLAKLSTAKLENIERENNDSGCKSESIDSKKLKISVSDQIDSKTQTKVIKSIDIDRFFLEDEEAQEAEHEDNTEYNCGILEQQNSLHHDIISVFTQKEVDGEEDLGKLQWKDMETHNIEPDFVATLTTKLCDEVYYNQGQIWEGGNVRQDKDRSDSSSVYFINREPTLGSKCNQSMSASMIVHNRLEEKQGSVTNQVCKNLGEMFADYSVTGVEDQENPGRRSHNLQNLIPAFGSREARSSSLQAKMEINGNELDEKKSQAQKGVMVNLNQDKVSPADEVFKKLMEKKLNEAREAKLNLGQHFEQPAIEISYQGEEAQSHMIQNHQANIVLDQNGSQANTKETRVEDIQDSKQVNGKDLSGQIPEANDSRMLLELILNSKVSESGRQLHREAILKHDNDLDRKISRESDSKPPTLSSEVVIRQKHESEIFVDTFIELTVPPIDKVALDVSGTIQMSTLSKFEREKSQLQREILSSNKKSTENLSDKDMGDKYSPVVEFEGLGGDLFQQVQKSSSIESGKNGREDYLENENENQITDLQEEVMNTQRANAEQKTEEDYANQEILFNLTETVNPRESEPRNTSPQNKTFEVSTIHEGFNSTSKQLQLGDQIDDFDPNFQEDYYNQPAHSFGGQFHESSSKQRMNLTEKICRISNLMKNCNTDRKKASAKVYEDEDLNDEKITESFENLEETSLHEDEVSKKIEKPTECAYEENNDTQHSKGFSESADDKELTQKIASLLHREREQPPRPPISRSKLVGKSISKKNEIEQPPTNLVHTNMNEFELNNSQQSEGMTGPDLENFKFESLQQNLELFEVQYQTIEKTNQESQSEVARNEILQLEKLYRQQTALAQNSSTEVPKMVGASEQIKFSNFGKNNFAENSLQTRIEQYQSSDERKDLECRSSSEVNISDSKGEDNLLIRNLSGEFERTTEKKGNKEQNLLKLDPHQRVQLQDKNPLYSEDTGNETVLRSVEGLEEQIYEDVRVVFDDENDSSLEKSQNHTYEDLPPKSTDKYDPNPTSDQNLLAQLI